MKCIVLIFLYVFLSGCSRKTCVDSVPLYRDMYKRHLIILKEALQPKKLVMPKETEEAISFLEMVSGIGSSAEIMDWLSYRSKADYKKDIRRWSEWYDKNKCRITLGYVDSAYRSRGLNLQGW